MSTMRSTVKRSGLADVCRSIVPLIPIIVVTRTHLFDCESNFSSVSRTSHGDHVLSDLVSHQALLHWVPMSQNILN